MNSNTFAASRGNPACPFRKKEPAISTEPLQHRPSPAPSSPTGSGPTQATTHSGQDELAGGDQLRAEIDRISFRNEDNGWSVLKARRIPDDSPVTVVGYFAAVREGEQFELFGSWTKHAQYGPQFKAERAVPMRPSTRQAIERYLASGIIKGIGPKTATQIVKHFGESALDVLDASPQRILEVPSIGQKKAEAIISSWEDQRSGSDVAMFLNAHGISAAYAARIIKAYGKDTIKVVSATPYRLASDIHGIGFLMADRIARSMGIPTDSPERLRAGTLYQLQQGEDRGHCFLTTPQLRTMLAAGLGLTEDGIDSALADGLGQLNASGAIATVQVTTQDEMAKAVVIDAHYTSDLLIAETNVAQRAARLLSLPMACDEDRLGAWLSRYGDASGTKLTDEQLDAVRKAAARRVFILTGGPGVGKTTTANAIIRLIKAMGRSVALGAPTGRAAQRLSEVAATPAKTIHRLLEWTPNVRGFARDEDNPLSVDCIIIDEASMLDTRLADALFRAVPDRAQLILIGDVDQLPSVGPGNVLRDLIDSAEVPSTRLTQIFRQAGHSHIVRAAHTINAGETPELEQEGDSDCLFLPAPTGDDITSIIKDLLAQRLPYLKAFDPATQVQVLTPMNRGELGTQTLNLCLQDLLNPASERNGGETRQQASLFKLDAASSPLDPSAASSAARTEGKPDARLLRIGDRVIQTVNNYDLGVFNGDIGYVQQTKVMGGKVIVAFGDDRIITYDDDQALDLRLAYAITIHKSQGSEFPVVIIPCTMQHFVMLQRNLLYTALTRARQLAIFVGSRRALAHAVRTQPSLARQTGLVERLRLAVRHP